MSLFSRSDLKYTYSWTAVPPDDPRRWGAPASSELNRSEGYEMLDFINTIADLAGITRKEAGWKIERMIRDHLPEEIRQRERVMNWITVNWNKN